VGALKATRFGDGLLRIAAIIVALKADMRTAIRYIGGLTATHGVGKVVQVRVASVALFIDRTWQQILR